MPVDDEKSIMQTGEAGYIMMDYEFSMHGVVHGSSEASALENKAIAGDPFWSEENQSVLAESIAQLRARKGTAHELIKA